MFHAENKVRDKIISWGIGCSSNNFLAHCVMIYFLYFSHITRQAQYEHPCAPHYIYQPEVRIHMEVQPRVLVPPPRHTHFHPHSVLVPANPYLNEGMFKYCT